MASSGIRGGLDWIVRKRSLLKTLGQAAQGNGGVTIPGEVQKPCRCGTLGHDLVGMVAMA